MNETAEALAAAKTRIIALQTQMTNRILQMAGEVEKLLEIAAEEEAREFLRVTCNLPSYELSTYIGFKSALKGKEELLAKARVSFPVVKALVAAKKEVRQEILERIEIGARIDVNEMSAIRRRIREEELGPNGIEAERYGRKLSAVARKQGAVVAFDLKAALGSFLEALPADYGKMKTNEIREAAKALHADFLRLFPAAENARPKRPGTLAFDLDLAINTLQALSKGTLERPESDGKRRDLRNPGIIALYSFAGQTPCSLWKREPIAQAPPKHHRKKVLELCAGAGGMSVGLERAGFEHVALYEYDHNAAATLRKNRPEWNVVEGDIRAVDFKVYRRGGIDLVSGGLPCQPYSTDGKSLGKNDPRDLLPEGVRVVREVKPKAFIFENVDGLLHAAHADHLANILKGFRSAGYHVDIHRAKAEDYGVAQHRNRVLIVGLRRDLVGAFRMPPRFPHRRSNIGDVLAPLMAENGWTGAFDWARERREQPIYDSDGEIVARGVLASTMVGRRGSPREKEGLRWAAKGINIGGIPDFAPTQEEASAPGFLPGLTLKMRAKLQDFPDKWEFCGGKDAIAIQVGNAVPAALAQAVGLAMYSAMSDVSWDWEALLWPAPLPAPSPTTPRKRPGKAAGRSASRRAVRQDHGVGVS